MIGSVNLRSSRFKASKLSREKGHIMFSFNYDEDGLDVLYITNEFGLDLMRVEDAKGGNPRVYFMTSLRYDRLLSLLNEFAEWRKQNVTA